MGTVLLDTLYIVCHFNLKFIICQSNYIFFIEKFQQFLEGLIVSGERGLVTDDDQLDLGPGDGHVESPGVEEDVAGTDLLDVSEVTAGAAVEDDELVPALVLVHGAHLHLRVL